MLHENEFFGCKGEGGLAIAGILFITFIVKSMRFCSGLSIGSDPQVIKSGFFVDEFVWFAGDNCTHVYPLLCYGILYRSANSAWTCHSTK